MASRAMSLRLIRGFSALNASVFNKFPQSSCALRRLTTATDTNEKDGEKAEASVELKEEMAKLEASMKEEKDSLNKKLSDLNDKYKRSLAETENVRRRMKKQVDDAKLFGIQGFCKDLLDVADILNKATESVPEDQINASNPHLKDLYEGLMMTETNLQKVFTKHGLIKINPAEGDKFDPNFHEALFRQHVPGKTDDTVALVTKIGYQLHERTLRPALVGVFKDS